MAGSFYLLGLAGAYLIMKMQDITVDELLLGIDTDIGTSTNKQKIV